uniref:Uncharacterized protein n=1 Tax=Meloidogyne hapla TaxID=6305 RepID=A0A1I8AZD5_MELHA
VAAAHLAAQPQQTPQQPSIPPPNPNILPQLIPQTTTQTGNILIQQPSIVWSFIFKIIFKN